MTGKAWGSKAYRANQAAAMSGADRLNRPRYHKPVLPRVNKYPGRCQVCGKPVAAAAGIAFKSGDRWSVRHKECKV